MQFDSKFLDMKGAAEYLGVSLRWMRRHWPDLLKEGVKVLRVPKDAPKGRLIVELQSLTTYAKACEIKNDGEFRVILGHNGK